MTKKPSAARVRGTKRIGLNQEDLPPLQWWWGEDKPSYDTDTLGKAVRQLSVLAYPNAPAALDGDEAVAVGIGLHVYAKVGAPAWLVDWAGSLLLLATLRGSLTAAVVLIHLRRQSQAAARSAAKRRRHR